MVTAQIITPPSESAVSRHADVLRLLRNVRERIYVGNILRASLFFLTFGCLQAILLIGFSVAFRHAGLWPAMVIVGLWPAAALFIRHVRRYFPPLRRMKLPVLPWRRICWIAPLSVLPPVGMLLLGHASSTWLVALDVVLICVISGLWSVERPSSHQISWAMDHQAGLEGSLVLWLETRGQTADAAPNPFYPLVWQRIQDRWPLLQTAAENFIYPPDRHEQSTGISLAVPIASAGFASLALACLILIAGNSIPGFGNSDASAGLPPIQSQRSASVAAVGNMASVHPALPHPLPPSLVRRIMARQAAAAKSGKSWLTHPRSAAAQIQRDLLARESWRKQLATLAAALKRQMATETGRPGAQNKPAPGGGAANHRPTAPESAPQDNASVVSAAAVAALRHAGLSQADATRIMVASHGFAGRSGKAAIIQLKAAIAAVAAARMNLMRELAAERRLLKKISAVSGVSPVGRVAKSATGGTVSKTAANGLHLPGSAGNNTGSEKIAADHQPVGGNRPWENGLVDGAATAVLAQPFSPAGPVSPVHGTAIPKITSQFTGAQSVPEEYRRILYRYFQP